MLELLNQFIPNIMDKLPDFWTAILETFIMLGIVGVISLLIGTLFGVIMVVTKKEGILENAILYFLIGKVIDFFRAIPFIVLIFLIAPMTRAIVGTTIGLRGAMLPLAVGAIPFVARQIESALSEVDNGLIEASQAMGCSPLEIIFRVYLKESVPGIIRATTITLITLIGYIAMVGVVGGGGLGDFCIRYGYNSFQFDVIYVCVAVLLLITSLIQGIGNIAIRKTTH
ncbi:ABC transporter permease [[Clostridium] innocuum]|uniref:methionine ABC transporter permease n=1 Tax=Clostridium innocuum TaxID=1522 RepID=UPI00214866A9|nr:methionine ABC transporter permease [[Clostridium] innocuum]MCR0272490.1 ABC transporter permease [[Clostridium] innocuum]